MKPYETKIYAADGKPLLARPWAEMEPDELLLVEGHCGRRIQELNNLFAEFRAISTARQKARAELLGRFGIDPRTGKRLRRKGRGELDLTG